jgi:uncharacterized membrane protein
VRLNVVLAFMRMNLVRISQSVGHVTVQFFSGMDVTTVGFALFATLRYAEEL